MKKLSLLFILFFGANAFLFSQNIEGKWIGSLDQSSGAEKVAGYEEYYKTGLWKKGEVTHLLTLTFTQNNNKITGEYFIQTRLDTASFAKFNFIGTIDSDTLNFKTTTKIIEKCRKGFSFCYNKTKLHYFVKGNYEYLRGEWIGWDELGNPCANSEIFVRRQKKEIKIEEPISVKHTQQIENRKTVILEKEFKTSKEFVKVKIWDANKVDGDIISLNLNGKWILENYEIKKQKRDIVIHLDPGENYLLLHAINLGRIPPNTASLSISDDENEERIVLKSDLSTSESFRIIRK